MRKVGESVQGEKSKDNEQMRCVEKCMFQRSLGPTIYRLRSMGHKPHLPQLKSHSTLQPTRCRRDITTSTSVHQLRHPRLVGLDDDC